MGTGVSEPVVAASYLYAARYEYSQAVLQNDNQVRVFPRDGEGQEALEHELWTEPNCRALPFTDRFGNQVNRVRVVEHHTRFVAATAGRVQLSTVAPQAAETSIDSMQDSLEHLEYTGATELVNPAQLTGLAGELIGDQAGLIEAVRSVTDWVHGNIRYLRGTTDVTTTAESVLNAGEGVCQDMAHLSLGLLRAAGAPCRYVSGLLTDQVGETHAWLEFLHPQAGWLPADPTRGTLLPPASDYVKLAVGLDYSDVRPISGTFISKGAAMHLAAIAEVRFGERDWSMADALALLDDALVVPRARRVGEGQSIAPAAKAAAVDRSMSQ